MVVNIGSVVFVIAYKFNDILYAINTLEFNTSEKRYLISFFDVNSMNICLKFDKVLELDYKRNLFSIVLNMVRVVKTFGFDCRATKGVFISSNYQILNSRMFFSILFSRLKGVYIEDGLMSYNLRGISLSNSFVDKLPLFFTRLLNLDSKSIESRLMSGYFFHPDEITWLSNPQKLVLEIGFSDTSAEEVQFINNKSVFFGQNLYDYYTWFTVDDYIAKVNDLYERGCFEFYAAHPQESQDLTSKIKAPKLCPPNDCRSVESFVSNIERLEIVTFYSSVSYTAPCLLKNYKVSFVKDFVLDERFDFATIKKLLDRFGVQYDFC